MGLSENSVPLNPLDYHHFPYQNSYLDLFGGILYFQTHPYVEHGVAQHTHPQKPGAPLWYQYSHSRP